MCPSIHTKYRMVIDNCDNEVLINPETYPGGAEMKWVTHIASGQEGRLRKPQWGIYIIIYIILFTST